MQKNLTSFFGKVAAVSPLVESNVHNEIRDLTAVNVSNCKEAALSSSIGIEFFKFCKGQKQKTVNY